MENKKKLQMPAGIRNKLLAAVSMLLVSTIMMVSTTYAWFTLSTAPEITGISTSVGANGNLEMALLNSATYANLDAITSAVGDSSSASGKTAVEANVTWGNLVDLKDESYGLQSIKLMPARLNVSDSKMVPLSPLKTPLYGADGRVKDVSELTYTSGTFAGSSWSFNATPTNGVRAIGATSAMTPQTVGLVAAKAAYNNELTAAKASIRTGMNTYGPDLSSAITALAMGNAAALNEGQQTAIKGMVDAALEAMGHIDLAYKQVLAAKATELTENYATVAADIAAASNYAAALASATGVTVPVTLTNAVNALTTQKDSITKVQTSLEGESPTNENYKNALAALVNTDKVTVNGFEVQESNATATDNLMVDGNVNSDFMSKVLNDGGVVVEMPTGSGVFAYIGEVAGNYTATTKANISYGDLTLNNVNITMQTNVTKDVAVDNVLTAVVPAETATAPVLSETYGYILDMAFRTNAASSYLQLQTEGAQRVYDDSNSAATQGGGSTMTFKSQIGGDAGTALLTDAQVVKLMQAIRVAFVNPEDGTIYGIASLTNITPDADGGQKGTLSLGEYSYNSDVLSVNAAKVNDDATADKDESIALMELTQNTPARMSIVVWLDGDYVDNGDVVNAAQSLTGSLNLQFSSSAKLQPMENTALKNMPVASSTNP